MRIMFADAIKKLSVFGIQPNRCLKEHLLKYSICWKIFQQA